MSYTQVICMKCSYQYIQETDPWGNYYPINVYMCGHCGTREIYKKELTDNEVEIIKENNYDRGTESRNS